jgi:hypothetical protein
MKKWLIASLAALLSLGVVMGGLTAVSADEASDDPDAVLDGQPVGDEAIVGDEHDALAAGRGTGYIVAHGDGVAGLEGKGKLFAAGRGVLYVKDVAGNMRIEIRGFGTQTQLPGGWTKYEGLGQAKIKGSHVKLVLRGPRVNVAARGKGRFVLHGLGRFDVNGLHGSWPARGAYST